MWRLLVLAILSAPCVLGDNLFWYNYGHIDSLSIDGGDITLLDSRSAFGGHGLAFLGENMYYIYNAPDNLRYISKFTMSEQTPTPERVSPPTDGHYMYVITAYSNEYKVSCPLEYTATRGRIQSPGYPGYRNNFELTNCSTSSPCVNGGTCVSEDFCVCSQNYTGDRCELVDDDPCRSLPCQNGAQCESLSSSYTCRCRPGTTGRHCETEQPCASVTCNNGGICKYSDAGMWCECQPGFTGQLCGTEMDMCESYPCENNGTCTPAFNQYHCACEADYSGVHCETDTNMCRNAPCENAGTCHNLIDGSFCQCVDGFSGQHCEKQSEQCSCSLNVPVIAGTSVGTLVIGFVIGIIVGMVVCRRRRQQPVDKAAAVEMRGDTTEQCNTEEKVSETTDFKDDVVHDDDEPVKDDDISEADFAAQQRAYSRQLHTSISNRPRAPNPRDTYVNAAMIPR
ncbi:hypothetical protein NP493_615g02070 [Ridgeia piscesae]|uniref:EGF-like domain-containing protein n=1 Tax=Ridgeia piscesae TaxID=27915 RepID=A0AAD9KUK3_RIDPI|nr:hypothetical protein NP493_615g02070 [Ridgeia piscesae]